jgi:hypothetical protein
MDLAAVFTAPRRSKFGGRSFTMTICRRASCALTYTKFKPPYAGQNGTTIRRVSQLPAARRTATTARLHQRHQLHKSLQRLSAPIAVMGGHQPERELLDFNHEAATAAHGRGRAATLGGFKRRLALVTRALYRPQSISAIAAATRQWHAPPFIWLDNFSGGMLDTPASPAPVQRSAWREPPAHSPSSPNRATPRISAKCGISDAKG